MYSSKKKKHENHGVPFALNPLKSVIYENHIKISNQFQVTANKMKSFSNYLFLKRLYMFQAVPPPIIRSTQV